MRNLLFAVLAVVGVSVGTAAISSADEAGFISSIDSLDYYAVDCPGCAQDALSVGYRVCKAFDRGGSAAAVQEVLRSYNGPDQTNAEYQANLFATYSAYQLCPAHNGEIGPI